MLCLVGVSMKIAQPEKKVWGYTAPNANCGPITGGLLYVPDGTMLEDCYDVLETPYHIAIGILDGRDEESHLLIKKEWVEFDFCNMGEMQGEHSSPLQWLCEGAGLEDVFMADDLVALYAIGKSILTESKDECPTVNFVTVWAYGGEYDCFGEFDEWWELHGRLDMSKLVIMEKDNGH